jgi:NADH-quinone oxidoreductase subunit G
MRVWFLKETKSICTSCSTGCNVIAGSREGVVYRYTPRRNDAVNSDWMCDYGRLNYKWVNDEHRIPSPLIKSINGSHSAIDWDSVLQRSREILTAAQGKLAIIASGRCTTEELFLIKKIAETYHVSLTEIVKRTEKADNILLSADRNPNTNGAILMGLTKDPGAAIRKIQEGIDQGSIKSLLVVNECAVKAGIAASSLNKLDGLIAIDLLPNETTNLASIVLPSVSHLEKRGTFINGKKRIQRFQQAFSAKGQARTDWELLKKLFPESNEPTFSTFEGLFQQMCQETKALSDLSWNAIGDLGIDLSQKI